MKKIDSKVSGPRQRPSIANRGKDRGAARETGWSLKDVLGVTGVVGFACIGYAMTRPSSPSAQPFYSPVEQARQKLKIPECKASLHLAVHLHDLVDEVLSAPALRTIPGVNASVDFANDFLNRSVERGCDTSSPHQGLFQVPGIIVADSLELGPQLSEERRDALIDRALHAARDPNGITLIGEVHESESAVAVRQRVLELAKLENHIVLVEGSLYGAVLGLGSIVYQPHLPVVASSSLVLGLEMPGKQLVGHIFRILAGLEAGHTNNGPEIARFLGRLAPADGQVALLDRALNRAPPNERNIVERFVSQLRPSFSMRSTEAAEKCAFQLQRESEDKDFHVFFSNLFSALDMQFDAIYREPMDDCLAQRDRGSCRFADHAASLLSRDDDFSAVIYHARATKPGIPITAFMGLGHVARTKYGADQHLARKLAQTVSSTAGNR